MTTPADRQLAQLVRRIAGPLAGAAWPGLTMQEIRAFAGTGWTAEQLGEALAWVGATAAADAWHLRGFDEWAAELLEQAAQRGVRVRAGQLEGPEDLRFLTVDLRQVAA